MSCWQSAGVPDYADLAPCGRCGKDVVLDHDAPCEHGYVACPECTHTAVCVDCRITAEQDMCASGVYSPAADPFIRHPAPPYAAQRVIYLDGTQWRYRDTDEEVEPRG